MTRRPVDRILADWDAVAGSVRRPAMAPRPRTAGHGSGAWSLVPLIALSLALVVGISWLGARSGGAPDGPGSSIPGGGVGASAPGATPGSSGATPDGSIAPCDLGELSVRITSWDGAAGNRIATIHLANAGVTACELAGVIRATLLDGSGAILATGPAAAPGKPIEIQPGARLSTLVDVANVCAVAPVAPVTVALDLGDDRRIVATPSSPTDLTLPPCNGSSRPADIQVQPWSPA